MHKKDKEALKEHGGGGGSAVGDDLHHLGLYCGKLGPGEKGPFKKTLERSPVRD